MQFFIIMTNAGLAKQAAWLSGGPAIQMTHLAVGDSNGAYYEPSAAQTALVAEKWRGAVGGVFLHPTMNQRVVIEAVIPPDAGGWDIREVGIFDNAGDLILVGKYPLTHKPAPGGGAMKELTVQCIMQLQNTAVAVLYESGAAFVTAAVFREGDWKNSVRLATTGNIALSGLFAIDGATLAANDPVLVKDQDDATQNGPWLASTGAWIRRPDAAQSAHVTSRMTVSVEEGTVNGGTIWQLATTGAITLGTTALTFTRIFPDDTALLAHLAAAAPHTGHETPAGAQAKVDAHADASAPHSGHISRSGVRLPDAANLNNAIDAGFFTVLNPIGGPAGAGPWLHLMVSRGDSDLFIWHIAHDQAADRCWMRRSFDSAGVRTWAAWRLLTGDEPGTYVFSASGIQPFGTLPCNFAAVSRTVYSGLFAKIGTTYGAGDGSTTFNVPETRGEFFRGWDDGRGVDSGRMIGSWQGHMFENHIHGGFGQNLTAPGGGGITYSAYPTSSNNNTGPAVSGNAGAETRPRNVACRIFIRF